MRHVLNRLSARYGWNQRPLTNLDFERIACAERVAIVDTCQVPEKALYLLWRGVPVVALDKDLTGIDRAFAGFHELAHYWLHTPSAAAFSLHTIDKCEWQANVIASCAIVPRSMLRSPDVRPLWQCPPEIIRLRAQVWERLKI